MSKYMYIKGLSLRVYRCMAVKIFEEKIKLDNLLNKVNGGGVSTKYLSLCELVHFILKLTY